MSNHSISHICKVKGLPKKFQVSPPWNTASSSRRVSTKIKETRLSPSLIWVTTLMAWASTKPRLLEQSKYFSTMHKAKPRDNPTKQDYHHPIFFLCFLFIDDACSPLSITWIVNHCLFKAWSWLCLCNYYDLFLNSNNLHMINAFSWN